MEQKFRDMNEPPKNEGEVTINKTSSSKKNSPDEGEFIDYEEVD